MEDMKIVQSDSNMGQIIQLQQSTPEQPQITENIKLSEISESHGEPQENEEILFVLKQEDSNENGDVITLGPNNCVNSDGRIIWVTNEQTGEEGDASGQQTIYSIKQINYAQVCCF
jgi:hypothetical protein